MITFKTLEHSGRLGNQLWQIASTVGIAYKLGEQPGFPNTWSYKPFFSVPDEMFLPPAELKGTESYETKPVDHIDPRARIYLQDYKLWNEIEDYIRQIFRPSLLAADVCASILPDLPRPWHCLHVRRGDNAFDPATPNKADYHPLRPLHFYQEALQRSKRTPEGESQGSTLCFSDDIDWCREQWGMDIDYYHPGVVRPKEQEADYMSVPVLDWIDLHLMTQCDTHVVPNSTYAWWGAFLSDDRSPYYSWPWFGPALSFIDAALMFPRSWTRLYTEGQNHGLRQSNCNLPPP